MNKERFYTTLKRCKEIYSRILGPNSGVQFDFDSKLYAEGIRKDISLIETLVNKNSRILDFGCGRGTIGAILSTSNFYIDGIDIKVPLEKGTMNLLSSVLPHKWQLKIWNVLEEQFSVNFSFHDGKKIPFDNEIFTAVIAYAVIEHVPPETLCSLLEEINRVLKPGGYFFIFRTPRSKSILERLAGLLKLGAHNILMDEKEVTSLLMKYGLKILDLDRTDMLPNLYILPKKLQNLLNFLHPLFSTLESLLLKTPLSYFATNMRIVTQKPYDDEDLIKSGSINKLRIKTKIFFNEEACQFDSNVINATLGTKYISSLEKEIVKNAIMKSQKQLNIVLDAGIGTGRFSQFLVDRGVEIIGIDISKNMLNISKRKLDPSKSSFVLCSAEHIPFQMNTLDSIVCMRTLKYLDSELALEEFAYVCKKDAIVIVQFANSQSYLNLSKHLKGPSGHYAFLNLLSLKKASELLKKNGFHIIDVKRDCRVPFFIYAKINNWFLLNILIKLEKILDAVLPDMLFSRSFIIVGVQKKKIFRGY